MSKIKLVMLPLLLVATQVMMAQDTKTITREKFTVRYPATWYIDKEDEDYDPDAMFSLDAPDDESFVMFHIIEMDIDSDILMSDQIEAFKEDMLKNPEISTFNTWGNLKGKGTLMKGKLAGIYKGYIRIFVYKDDERTLLVLEQSYDKVLELFKKDYDLIANSFKFK